MELIDALRSALAGRYEIERELGHGGTAVVYLAHDLKHHRAVAVKLLRPELAVGLGAERFLREIRLVAQLQHPHILPMHDSGEADGMLYYVMPYIQEESLRQRLRRERHLPITAALRIAREIAGALAYAHSLGIVHRDIKPENILFSAGHAIVTDFGIARAIDVAREENITAVGLAVGTPAYMSPEQAAADAPIDGRSDIYSLGCVLFEMIAGEPPFLGPNVRAVLYRHAQDPIPSLTDKREGVPPIVEQIVRKAMARLPADRFATAYELQQALDLAIGDTSGEMDRFRARLTPRGIRPIRRRATARNFMIGAALVFVVGALIALTRHYTPAATRGAELSSARMTDRTSIAVLPFVNVSGKPENEYLSDGITDELINEIAKMGTVRVTSRTSAFSFKGKQIDVRQIGSTLGVGTILEGSVRREGDTLRVTAQLIDAHDGYGLWSQSYDRQLSDVFKVEEDISRSIASALQMHLSVAAAAHADTSAPTSDVRAHEAYLEGRHFADRRTADGVRLAIQQYQHAVDIDPQYAQAYAGLADSHFLLAQYFGAPPQDEYPLSRAAAEKALSFDSTLAEAHTTLAGELLNYEWRWADAERELRLAIADNASYATAHQWLALLLVRQGRDSEAIVEARRAVALEPLSSLMNAALAGVYLYSGHIPEAEQAAHKTLELDPDYSPGHAVLGLIYAAHRDYPHAIAETRQALQLSHSPTMIAGLGQLYALSGQRDSALAMQRELLKQRYASPVYMAVVFVGLGDKARAVDWLERGYQAHDGWMIELATHPWFLPLHGDPKFEDLVRRVGIRR